jgi:hypothetical protein
MLDLSKEGVKKALQTKKFFCMKFDEFGSLFSLQITF